jgi:N-acetylglucosamine malate deacetylase 1
MHSSPDRAGSGLDMVSASPADAKGSRSGGGAHRLRVLVFGAHPDDADLTAGGTTALYTRAGHSVRLVSVADGSAGHYRMERSALAERRREEAAAAGRALGAEYLVLDHPDGALVPDLRLREEIIALIRGYAPDLVLSPRPWDYHPDHRATAQLVQDAIYLLTVPLVVPEVPHLRRMPVHAYVADRFTVPRPIRPDVVVDIGAVLEVKIEAVACHASQVYEWLPYNRGVEDSVPVEPSARRAWLEEWLRPRFGRAADSYRAALEARYGPERGAAASFAEAFEISEYGHQPTVEDLARLFPF